MKIIQLIHTQLRINETAGQTKVQQLVHAISEAISADQLKTGDVLPSVNQLSAESGFSRDTVFKAYSILRKRNIIESAPTKGYYVASESHKIFMLLDDFSAFKEQLYQSFRQNLPDSYSVDLLFHHYNQEVFEQLIQNSLGRYNTYIVMNIDNKNAAPILKKIDSNKLLLLDMGTPGGIDYNFILQDFNQAVKDCLEQGLSHLKKYDELVMVYSEKYTPHPQETVQAVKQFCKKNDVRFVVTNQIDDFQITPGKAYFLIRETDLVRVIKTCRSKKYMPGKDVGIISYNDTPMKQIVGNGISVISTDFEKMGLLAAEFVKNKQRVKKVLPTFLTLRGSF